jgi:nicotinate-nucleotide adenylyltransferase
MLQKRYPRIRFIWLMGADNLANFHRWKRWAAILSLAPVAVFDRAPYSHSALRSKAALRFAPFRLRERQWANPLPPAWAYIAMRRDAASATAIRKTLGKAPVLRHNENVRTGSLHS